MINDDHTGIRTHGGIQLDDGVGGFGPGMEVFTTNGPRPVEEICDDDVVYALNPSTRLVKRKPVTDVQTRSYRGRLVSIRTRRVDLVLAPTHPLLFHTETYQWARFETAAEAGERWNHQLVSEWRTPPKRPLQTVDITDLTDEFQACVQTDLHGHAFRATLPDGCLPVYNSQSVGHCFDAATFKQHQESIEEVGTTIGIRAGKNHRPRPYRFDGDDFVRFLGWFVTEGSVYWKKDRNSAVIQIAQQNPEYRQEIQALLDRMGLPYRETERAFRIGSYLYGRLLVSLCGASSHEKRLPPLVWDLPTEQRRLLLETLIAGDGNERGTYYTASDQLAADVLALGVTLGIKPRYTRQRGEWQLFLNEVNDSFQTGTHLRHKLTDGSMVRLSVADYPAVLAGRDGRFQWVGVNGVA